MKTEIMPAGFAAQVMFFSAALVFVFWSLSLAGGKNRPADRVSTARRNKAPEIVRSFSSAGLSYPAYHVFLRGFKREQVLEVWARKADAAEYVLVKRYPICYVPGRLGPKRKQGDSQVPEGVYRITVWNPFSRFHLSLGLDYPNRADRIRNPKDPGGEIFIHGECVSIGCIPIENGPIEEVYLITLDSKNKFKQAPAVHLFPCRMETSDCRQAMRQAEAENPALAAFWQELRPIYDAFEKSRRLSSVVIDHAGRYVMK